MKKKEEEKKYVPTHRVSQGITRGFINFMTMNDIAPEKKGIKFIDTMFLILILGFLLCHHFVIMTSLRADICRYHLKNRMNKWKSSLKN